jgi:hypothetical protein
MDYDDKNYYDQDDLVIHVDGETGEEYVIRADGSRRYLAEY